MLRVFSRGKERATFSLWFLGVFDAFTAGHLTASGGANPLISTGKTLQESVRWAPGQQKAPQEAGLTRATGDYSR